MNGVAITKSNCDFSDRVSPYPAFRPRSWSQAVTIRLAATGLMGLTCGKLALP